MEEIGSSIKLLMVAEGAAHCYPRLAPTMEWDTAAADIIVREAGGVVLQAGSCNGSGGWRRTAAERQPLSAAVPCACCCAVRHGCE